MDQLKRYPSRPQALTFFRDILDRQHGVASWVDKEFAFSLWFGFLTISPSYELATRYRANELSDGDRSLLPADFDQVLEVYDDLGPVRGVDFLKWWPTARHRNFGYKGSRPAMMHVGTLGEDGNADRIQQTLAALAQHTERAPEMQNAAVLTVPLGLPRRQLMRQFSALIDRLQTDVVEVKLPPPKYKLARTRQDNRSLFGYLNLAWKRSGSVQPLWRVGFDAGFSGTYTKAINARLQANVEPTADQKERLKILTSRGLARAWLIAENAARGTFPSYKKCPTAVSLKQFPIYDIVREQNRAAQLSRWLQLYPKLDQEER